MSYITVGKENSGNIDIYYEDLGSGQPCTAGLSQTGKLISISKSAQGGLNILSIFRL